MTTGWKKLIPVSKDGLTKTRRLIHQAIQLPAITGRCLNNEDRDDKAAALTWITAKNMFASHFWTGNNHRSAFSISEIKLNILNREENIVSEFSLEGKTFDDALNWLASRLSALGYDEKKISKKLPYQIPHYKYADNHPFQKLEKDLLIEFQKHYANANLILNEVKSRYNSSQVLCWPHHFDIATTIIVEENSDPEKSKSIGLGMSPGDESYDQPYYYVSPWPYPADKNSLPNLPAGKWHTENWFGAVLSSGEITKLNEGNDQFNLTTEFINSAVTAAKNLL